LIIEAKKYMLKKHQTLSYITSRVKQMLFERSNPDAPWLTQQSIELLAQLIKKTDNGLEFGSGRITKWLAKRCHHLISIEHYKEWYEKVKADISNLDNVSYHYKSIEGESAIQSPYYQIINTIENNSIDFCLVDGKHRDVLCLGTIEKLKSGGLLILDNAERYLVNDSVTPASIGMDDSRLTPAANEFIVLTNAWRRIWTDNGVSTTLILFKP
jgi:predicted O-methyltransferase YrrM